MDIQGKINEIVSKIKNDKGIQEKFAKDPAGAVEDILGISIPKEQLDGVITAVKAKLGSEKLGGALDAIGGLFGKNK